MTSKRILILDDDMHRMVAYNKLFIGHIVDMCYHAADCIDLLKRNEYDLIFLDHDLNGKQIQYDTDDCGTVVAEWIKDNPIRGQVIIHSFNDDRGKYMESIIKNSEYVPGAWIAAIFEMYVKKYFN